MDLIFADRTTELADEVNLKALRITEKEQHNYWKQRKGNHQFCFSSKVINFTMSATIEKKKPLIGIFAIQGAVEEHANLVLKCGGDVKEVRTHSELLHFGCALSTTYSLTDSVVHLD